MRTIISATDAAFNFNLDSSLFSPGALPSLSSFISPFSSFLSSFTLSPPFSLPFLPPLFLPPFLRLSLLPPFILPLILLLHSLLLSHSPPTILAKDFIVSMTIYCIFSTVHCGMGATLYKLRENIVPTIRAFVSSLIVWPETPRSHFFGCTCLPHGCGQRTKKKEISL